jgi:aspartate/methionine/tyrosine aminotransferase
VEAMKQVVQLCYDESLLLLADEVYQANIFDKENKPFVSFKKVLREMEKEVAEGVELVSFHSISKGVSGECGRRGGYFEAVNLDEGVMEQIYKMASVNLCPPITGQVGLLSSSLPRIFPPSLLTSHILRRFPNPLARLRRHLSAFSFTICSSPVQG